VRDPSEAAATAAEILDGLGVRWALMGALAADRYRHRPRLTTDVDVLVEPDAQLRSAFEAAGYEVQPAGDGEQPDMLLVRGRGDRIDVLLATVDYLRTALDRADRRVITVEDVIVQKLIAWRPRDRDDVASILEAGHALDDGYIATWATAFDVVDRWGQAQVWRP
jgi:dsDNA-binding SOS-regulon protein